MTTDNNAAANSSSGSSSGGRFSNLLNRLSEARESRRQSRAAKVAFRASTKSEGPSRGKTMAMSFFNSSKNKGFILLILSVLLFVLTKKFGIPDFYTYLSIGLMILASILLFGFRGFFATLGFLIWWLVFRSSSDLTAIITSFISTLVLGTLLSAILRMGNDQGETFKQALIYNFFIGLILFFVCLVDSGIMQYFLTEGGVPLPEVLATILSLLPLWAFIGLMAIMGDEEHRTLLTTLLMIGGILYLVGLIIFVSTTVSALNQASGGILPTPEELAEAKQKYEPQGENPFITNIYCIGTGKFQDLAGCVEERQKAKQIEATCKQLIEAKEYAEDELDVCIEEETERRRAEDLGLAGKIDRALSIPMKVDFEIDDYFPKQVYREPSEDAPLRYPLQLEIENPREQNLNLALSCYLEDSDEDKIVGVAKPSQITSTETSLSRAVVCEFPAEAVADGTYTLKYEVLFSGLTTPTFLSRAFIGAKTSAWKEEWLPRITQTHFANQDYLPRSPQDLARLNFAFGNSFSDPIIKTGEDNSEAIFLAANVENLGTGEIVKINSYDLYLDGFNVDDSECLSGGEKVISEERRSRHQSIPLPTCTIEQLPFELENPDDYVFKEFEATLNYDYLAREEVTQVQIEVLES